MLDIFDVKLKRQTALYLTLNKSAPLFETRFLMLELNNLL